MKMTQDELNKVLELHKKWLSGDEGERADLRYADLRYADLRSADLSSADLSSADLRSADLSYADLRSANLSSANLSSADLSSADLRSADLSSANLSSANLSSADLSSADLRSADLSYAQNLLSSINYLDANFEKTSDGYIAYKTFNGTYSQNLNWKIENGSVINEVVNPNRQDICGCGINIAPIEWVKSNYKGEIWKVLIRWEWLVGVIVPYNTDGKIRCERCELIEIVR